jgi:alkyldihydroxyacetonephosphate synthase
MANRVGRLAASGCLLVLTYEGAWDLIRPEEKLAREIARKIGGRDDGPAPARHWWETRYNVSYRQSQLFYQGAFVDTMEVVARWDRLEDLYNRVREAIAPLALILAHFSHAYAEGCNIYFTFAAMADGPEETEDCYRAIWEAGMKACMEAGGAVSHHHGIGLLKERYLTEELGSLFHVYRAVKKALDPNDILNPGKMGL